MTDTLITEQKVRLILDKTYIDGVKSGKGGLGYSERAFEQFMDLLAQAKLEEREKILALLVDEEYPTTDPDSIYYGKMFVFPKNEWNAELRQQIKDMKQYDKK